VRGRSRKDSRRRITVDGSVYHWRVAPDDGFVALLVRADGSAGQRLWAKFRYHDAADGHRLVTPRVVRVAILAGLQRGWNPAVTVPPLLRVYDGDTLLPAEAGPRTVGRRKAEPVAAADRHAPGEL
jgi:hypothetical protein